MGPEGNIASYVGSISSAIETVWAWVADLARFTRAVADACCGVPPSGNQIPGLHTARTSELVLAVRSRRRWTYLLVGLSVLRSAVPCIARQWKSYPIYLRAGPAGQRSSVDPIAQIDPCCDILAEANDATVIGWHPFRPLR